MITPSAPERLRGVGLRVTRPRAAVLEVLDAASAGHEHLTVAVVAERARPRLGTVSLQAVYDCITALTGAGLLREIELAGHPARYETRVGDGHHHLVCRSCARITDVHGVLGPDLCLTPARPATTPAGTQPSGFLVEDTEVTFWGLCAACVAGTSLLNSHPHSTEERLIDE